MENKKAPHQRSEEQALRGMRSKYTTFATQKKAFAQFLSDHTATSSMASIATGIPQKNLTRYKRKLEDEGRLKVVTTTICRATGHRADYLTTNKLLIEKLNNNA